MLQESKVSGSFRSDQSMKIKSKYFCQKTKRVCIQSCTCLSTTNPHCQNTHFVLFQRWRHWWLTEDSRYAWSPAYRGGVVCRLVQADRMEVRLTSGDRMIPKKSTSLVIGVGVNRPGGNRPRYVSDATWIKSCPYNVHSTDEMKNGNGWKRQKWVWGWIGTFGQARILFGRRVHLGLFA